MSMKKCDSDHKPDVEAIYRCPKCGCYYCDECAMLSDYQCGCVEPPELKRIKKRDD
jgi:hypothetical protein